MNDKTTTTAAADAGTTVAGTDATATTTTAGADTGTVDAGKTPEAAKAADTTTIAAPGGTAAADAAAAAAAAAAGAADGKGDGKPADGKPADGKAPDAAVAADWRVAIAGEDKDTLKRLERFPDQKALYQSYRDLEKRLSSGQLTKKLGPDAKPEEVATWRKENGIPDSADGYIEAFASDDGLVLSDADKPIVGSIAEAAHAGHVTPAAFTGIVKKYYEIQEQQLAAQNDADIAFKQESDDALRAQWGGDFRTNVVAIENLVAGWPEGVAERFLAGRTKDGKVIGNDPAILQQLATLSRELNPMPTLVPNGGADQLKAGQARIDEIKGWMGAKQGSPEYNRYWNDPKLQQEYTELLVGVDKLKARSA